VGPEGLEPPTKPL